MFNPCYLSGQLYYGDQKKEDGTADYHLTDSTADYSVSPPQSPPLGFDGSEGFHTYTFDWKSDSLIWYVDGVEMVRRYDNIPNFPEMLFLSLYTTATNPNEVIGKNWEIDYIRVYGDPANVVNSMSPELAPTPIRIDDKAACGGQWEDWSCPNQAYGDSQKQLNFTDAYVQYKFNATSIRWIGYSSSSCGKADVYIDGILDSTVDTYSPNSAYQRILYTKTGLSSGDHTIKIVRRSDHNPNSSNYWIAVDAFDISNGGTTVRVDDRVVCNGQWEDWSCPNQAYGDSQKQLNSTDSYIQYKFNGTSVKWIGYTSSSGGKADVYIDGTLDSTIDTYSANCEFKKVLYSKSGLTKEDHTIKIVRRSDHNASSSGYWVITDAFDISNGEPATVRIDDKVICSGQWEDWVCQGQAYGDSQKQLNSTDAYVEYKFNGTSVKWIGYTSSSCGKADVYIDGVLDSTVDTYSPNYEFQKVLYTKAGLSRGDHTIKIVRRSDHNPNSSNYWIEVDAFDITNGGTNIRVDDKVICSGQWEDWSCPDQAYGDSQKELNSTNAYIQYRFNGTSVKWIGYTSSSCGKADVYIDGVWDSIVDTYSANYEFQKELYVRNGLVNGEHTIKIVRRSDHNQNSSGYWIDVDAFDITN